MHNLVKLVQASGKGILVPAPAIASGIVRSLTPREQEANPKGASFVWLVLDGVAQSAIVRERMGFILNKAGGASSEREKVIGCDGEQISMPRSIFAFAIESERVTDAAGKLLSAQDAAAKEKRGETVVRTDATILRTSLRSAAGGVDFFVKTSAADLFDQFTSDVSEDNGEEEYDDDGNLIVAEAPKAARPRRAKAA